MVPVSISRWISSPSARCHCIVLGPFLADRYLNGRPAASKLRVADVCSAHDVLDIRCASSRVTLSVNSGGRGTVCRGRHFAVNDVLGVATDSSVSIVLGLGAD